MTAGERGWWRTRWRYLVPAAAAGVVGLVATGVFSAQAAPPLPPRTAAQLLADLQTADVAGFSGTVVQKASLGLPQLPDVAGSGSELSLMSLLTGTNTLKVWYGGPTRQRIALLDPVAEMDVFHDGADVWQWDSSTRTATHLSTPEAASAGSQPPGTVTPDQLAQQAVAAIDPTTEVRVDTTTRVAGRAVYRLVLLPRDGATRIGSVTVEIDGETKVPLGTQVYARGASSPAMDVSFTDIDFGAPDAANFTFTPPAGSTITRVDANAPTGMGRSVAADSASSATTVGAGWTRVVVMHTALAGSSTSKQLDSFLKPVSGAWGSGRLLTSSLLSALILDDGRVLVGAVDPERLYAAVNP